MKDRMLARAGIHECTFDAEGVTINFAQGSDSAGPALVLIPGQALPWQSYLRALPLLAQRFRVFAVDVRGHGKSSWTTGDYTFNSIGKDFSLFLEQVVREPVFVSGNSSGGVIAVWLGAIRPDLVRGVICEDAPLFSCEWPRIRDCFVYGVFEKGVRFLGAPGGRDLAGFLGAIEVPVQGSTKVLSFPRVVRVGVKSFLWFYRLFRPSGPVDIPFLPLESRVLIKGLSEYDPDFSRACIDGSIGKGLSHADALAKLRCPLLLMRANWFRHPMLGLVGSMDDDDLARAKSIMPGLKYVQISSGHMVHLEDPQAYVSELSGFISECAR